MSLLLDALKKAAEDKKNKKSGDADSKADTGEDLDLDLDIQENGEFPEVDESLAEQRAREHREAMHKEQQAAGAEASKDPAPAAETPLTIEPKDDEALPVEDTPSAESPEPAVPEEEPANIESNPVDDAAPQAETELSIEEIIQHDQSSQDRDVLKFLINKSNQQSDRIRFRKRLMYGSLAALILLVLGVFAYFKWLAVSERLYTGDTISREPIRTAPAAPEETPPSQPVEQPPVSTAQVEQTRPPSPAEKEPEPIVAAPTPAPDRKNLRRERQPAPVQKAPIRIVQKTVVDPTEELLRRAYALFNEGEYEASRDLYLKVLAREPKNRDALLGVAAIAVKQNRLEAARQKYLYLLQLNPRDSLARAGLSAVEGDMNADLDESQLKLMLREQPEAAHLYFALGSRYAARAQWAEAQSAFFSAWAADSSNPDYAFNLAVSLDHLGKLQQAVEFYRKSLQLSDLSTANFSRQRVIDRIARLEARHE